MEDESVRSKSGGFISRLGTSRSIRLNTVPAKYLFLSPRFDARLNTSQLRAERDFSGDLKTEVERLHQENSALGNSIMVNHHHHHRHHYHHHHCQGEPNHYHGSCLIVCYQPGPWHLGVSNKVMIWRYLCVTS